MPIPLRVLLIEDSETDALLNLRELEVAGFVCDWLRVETEEEFIQGLHPPPDIILTDWSVPQCSTREALRILRDHSLNTPVLIVSGSVSTEAAREAMILGAVDFLHKDDLTHLREAVTRAVLRGAQRAEAALRDANAALWRVRQELHERKQEVEGSCDGNEQFRAVAETAADAIVSADESGRIIFFNRSAETMFGYRSAEVLHQSLTMLMPLRFRAAHLAGLERYLTTGQSHIIGRTLELSGQRKEGGEFPLELSLACWIKGVERYFTAMLRDITARKQAEQALRERGLQLESANKDLEAFSYSVSHDLRSPLRAIDGFSRILHEKVASQLPLEAQQYLRFIRDNAQQMDRLIQDLLALSRSSYQPLHKQPVDVVALVREVLEKLREEQPGRQVEVAIAELPGCQADPALLRQVWVNLLGNALKYTRQCNPAQVKVGSRVADAESVFFVQDNGAGFDMKYADKLFGVFQRLHRADEFEGTGIGLAIVQRIVNRHGGRVWAEAKIHEGATFFFTLGEGAP